jgi:hypothetical protein
VVDLQMITRKRVRIAEGPLIDQCE